MAGRAVAILLCALSSAHCDGSADLAGDAVVVRVSAGHSLGSFVPGQMSGSAAYLASLVYLPLFEYVRIESHNGTRVTLARTSDLVSDEDIARHMRYAGLVSATTTAPGVIVAQFESDKWAHGFSTDGSARLDMGPFEVRSNADSPRQGVVELRSREPGTKVDVIEMIEMPVSEEWKRLYGRDVDVVPITDAVHRVRFQEMRSVRVIDHPVTNNLALIFNVRDPILAVAATRRALAGAIDRQGIARSACGTLECAALEWEVPAADVQTELDALGTDGGAARLSLAYMAMDSTAGVVAKAVAVQLYGRGVSVDVEPIVNIEDVSRRLREERFQLLLLPMPHDAMVAAQDFGQAATYGFGDARLDELRAAGDVGGIRATLAREMPALPLIELSFFAAIDSSFCGARPGKSPLDLSWIAQLYPCEEGP